MLQLPRSTSRYFLGKQAVVKEFLIMDDATENIVLGMDFLRTFDTTFSCGALHVSAIPNSTLNNTSMYPSERVNSNDNITTKVARNFALRTTKGNHKVVTETLSRQPVHATPTEPPNWLEKRVAAVRRDPAMFPDYAIMGTQLYRRFNQGDHNQDVTPWKLCVGRPQQLQVMREVHDQAAGGHLGVRKTKCMLAHRYYRPGMSRDVSKYVRSCEICQHYKLSQHVPDVKMLSRTSEEWDRHLQTITGRKNHAEACTGRAKFHRVIIVTNILVIITHIGVIIGRINSIRGRIQCIIVTISHTGENHSVIIITNILVVITHIGVIIGRINSIRGRIQCIIVTSSHTGESHRIARKSETNTQQHTPHPTEL